MGSAVMNKHGGARSRSVPHRNLRTQTARPVYGVRCENRKSAGRTGTSGELGTGLLKHDLFTGAGYPQVPELRVPAGIRRGHAEHMSRHDTADRTPTPPAGLPPAPRSWPHIALRGRPITAQGGEPQPPWPRRSHEPPAPGTRGGGMLRRRTGVPGHIAHTRHSRTAAVHPDLRDHARRLPATHRGPRFARLLWCADNRRKTGAGRNVAAPTLSAADTTGNEPERRPYGAETSTTARPAVRRFVQARDGAHHRGMPAPRSAHAGRSARAASDATGAGRSRPAGSAAPAASATGRRAVAQVIRPESSEAGAAGLGDIERRARRYERRMAHSTFPPGDRDPVPVLLDAFASQRADPGRRSPTVPPDNSPLPIGIPSRFAPGRRFRRAPVRNPIRRAAPEDHTGPRSRLFRYRSVAGDVARGAPRHPAVARGPADDRSAQVHALRNAGDVRFSAAAPRISKRRDPAGDLPAAGARLRAGGWSPVTRVVTVGGNGLVTRSVSVRARHRRSVAGQRRWDVLLGAAFTTVLVAFPLGPGATAAAYSGGPVVLAQSFTGDTAESRGSTGMHGASFLPPSSSADGAQPRTAPIIEPADDDVHPGATGVMTRALSVSHEEATPASSTVAAVRPALGRTVPGPNPAVAGEGPTTPGAVAACGGSGSASGSGSESSWSGSAELAAGSASGSACTVVPALGELLRTLIRLAPKIAPPCPCPNGRK